MKLQNGVLYLDAGEELTWQHQLWIIHNGYGCVTLEPASEPVEIIESQGPAIPAEVHNTTRIDPEAAMQAARDLCR